RSESVLQSAHKAADIAVFDWLVQDNEVAWSGELRLLFGLDPADDQAEDWLSLLEPEDRDRVQGEIRRLLHNREREYRFEFHVTPATGGTKWLLGAGAIVYLPDKRQC